MNVNINIKNFKKGHVYLQKVTDSAIVNIDSIFVKNEKPIIFEYDIDSPELFYVNLDISKLDNRIEFFGEKGGWCLAKSDTIFCDAYYFCMAEMQIGGDHAY